MSACQFYDAHRPNQKMCRRPHHLLTGQWHPCDHLNLSLANIYLGIILTGFLSPLPWPSPYAELLTSRVLLICCLIQSGPSIIKEICPWPSGTICCKKHVQAWSKTCRVFVSPEIVLPPFLTSLARWGVTLWSLSFCAALSAMRKCNPWRNQQNCYC